MVRCLKRLPYGRIMGDPVLYCDDRKTLQNVLKNVNFNERRSDLCW